MSVHKRLWLHGAVARFTLVLLWLCQSRRTVGGRQKVGRTGEWHAAMGRRGYQTGAAAARTTVHGASAQPSELHCVLHSCNGVNHFLWYLVFTQMKSSCFVYIWHLMCPVSSSLSTMPAAAVWIWRPKTTPSQVSLKVCANIFSFLVIQTVIKKWIIKTNSLKNKTNTK